MHIQQGLSHKISELPPPARNIITFFKVKTQIQLVQCLSKSGSTVLILYVHPSLIAWLINIFHVVFSCVMSYNVFC